MSKILTEREKRFCYYLSKLESPKEAAIKAGYSPRRADSTSSRLMQRPEILREYKQFGDLDTQQLRQKLLCGIIKLAFGTSADGAKLALFSDELDNDQLDGLDLFQVSELKRREGGFEVKFFDRYKALEMLEQIVNQEEDSGFASELLGALNTAAGRLAPGADKDE